MKINKKLIILPLVILIIVVGFSYIRLSLMKASIPYEKSKTPSLEDAPVRLYGLIEPLKREVFIGPQNPRKVTRIYVQEGQFIKAGKILCELESEVEQQAYIVAVAKIEEYQRRLDLLIDELNRKKKLLEEEIIPEFNVTQKILEEKVLQQQILIAKEEAKLRKSELETFILRSPIDGYIYKFDIRIGELFTPQDYKKIIIGHPEKQVRLFIESFWLDKIKIGEEFIVKDSETNITIGRAKLMTISQYVGTRDFRTEDPLERLDTKYAQAILEFEKASPVPIGKLVLCEKLQEKSQRVTH